MYYIETISPNKRCAQWPELEIYYAYALTQLPPNRLPRLEDLIKAYSHFKEQGMETKFQPKGDSLSFYLLAPTLLKMTRLHLYMHDHGIFDVTRSKRVRDRIKAIRRNPNIPPIQELQRPFIEHYAYVHEKLNADPKYGLRREQYFNTPGKDGFIPKHLDFSLLFHGLSEIKQYFNHLPIPSGHSQAQVEMGRRPSTDIIQKLKKNMYAERPDTTFKSLYRKNPHSQYPTERLFEKDLLRLHRRVRARTESNSIHHYVHELGFVFNSADIHHWEEYFVKHTHVRSFERLVAYLDQELQSV